VIKEVPDKDYLDRLKRVKSLDPGGKAE